MKIYSVNRFKIFFFVIIFFCFSSVQIFAEKFQRPLNIIIMESMTLKQVQDGADKLIKYMSDEYGLKPGVHVQYTRINAKGEMNTGIIKLHETMDIVQPDLVISIATVASKAAKKVLEKTNVPQIFFYVTDPIEAGLIKSFDATHDNISGIAHVVAPEIKLSMISRVLESVHEKQQFNIAFLNTSYPSEKYEKTQIQKVLSNYPNINLLDIEIEYVPEQTSRMADLFGSKLKEVNAKTPIDFVWVADGPNALTPSFLSNVRNKTNKEFICVNHEEAVKKGGLISVSVSFDSHVKAIADYVYKSINGDVVSHMPVRYADEYEISVNLETAKKHHIVIPHDLLVLANDRVYQ